MPGVFVFMYLFFNRLYRSTFSSNRAGLDFAYQPSRRGEDRSTTAILKGSLKMISTVRGIFITCVLLLIPSTAVSWAQG